MPNNDVQTVKIGGVTFNKSDVKSSEVVIKDGKKTNSVFLQDGTHLEFPNQSADNQSTVSQGNRTYIQPAYKWGYNIRSGKHEYHLTYETKEDPSKKVTNFQRMSGATITGTENEDTYNMYGCQNTTVDVSQNDGKSDIVTDSKGHTGSIFGGTDWSHDNNTFKLDDSDNATVVQDTFLPKDKHYKGKGTYNSGTGNK